MRAEMFDTLKTALKARGMTYADLARALGTSEPTIKRLFAARDAKLSRIVAICEVLGVPFEDIVAQAERADVPPMRLDRRVEAGLARRPALFHLFVLLREGLSPAKAATALNLDDGTSFRMALALERLGLAEVGPVAASGSPIAGPSRSTPKARSTPC
ncbi:MAG: helix-turn-helix transcriptional regulator [Pseudomonadota bacterium]